MSTLLTTDPLADFSRSTLGTYAVPHPVRAAATDSIIKESRKAVPSAAINERETPRLTIGELNDMDMDEIKKRFYSTRIDTRGPVTRFLDLIDLPRNALFNLAARDTAKRKFAQNDTAALGLARINTSDVLESLGVRPGLASGIIGFVGDVALDPLTYVGPAGWGAQAASKGGKTVSWTKGFAKVADEAVNAAKAGRAAADPAVSKYLASIGHTAESIAAHPDKAKLSAEIREVLHGGEPTRVNKVMSILGEDKVYEPSKTRTLADDVYSYRTKDSPLEAANRVLAADELYRTHGRPFSKGVRFIRDETSPLGFRLSTSREIPHGSMVAHIPFTDIGVSVPAFTPFAKKQGLLASLTKNSMANYDESVHLTQLREINDHLDDIYNSAKDASDYVNAASKAAPVDSPESLLSRAGTTFVPEELPELSDINRDARVMYDEATGAMAKIMQNMREDPLTSYADMLYANDIFKAQFAKQQIVRAEADAATAAASDISKFSAKVNEDVSNLVNRDIDGYRSKVVEENAKRAEARNRVVAEYPNVEAGYGDYVKSVEDENPAIRSTVAETFDTNNKKTTGISKNKLANEADPAFYETSPEEMKRLRYTPPGEERDLLARTMWGQNQIDATPTDEFGIVPDDAQRVYETVDVPLEEVRKRVSSTDSQAFVGLQMGMKQNGHFTGHVSKIDLNKVKNGDVWYMGDAKVTVIDNGNDTVSLAVDMPSTSKTIDSTMMKQSDKAKASAAKRQKVGKVEDVQQFENTRYYTIDKTETPYASHASKRSGNVTVERLDDEGNLETFTRKPLTQEMRHQYALQSLELTPDDLTDVRLGHGTEHAGMDEEDIRLALADKHRKQQLDLINQRKDSVPIFATEEEIMAREAYADALNAKATAAALLADATQAPLLSGMGANVAGALDLFRETVGLGHDDLGSSVMASFAAVAQMANSQKGRAVYETVKNLERTLVNNLGLAPGIASDMVKQFVRAKDIQQTQAFKTAVSDMVQILRDAGITHEESAAASSLAMALRFAGDQDIKLLASYDQAGKDIIEAMNTGLLSDPKKAAAIREIADKYGQVLDRFGMENGIPNYVPNIPTPQAQYLMDFQKNNKMGTFGTFKSKTGQTVSPAQETLERFQNKRSTVEHVWRDPTTNQERKMLESELAYLQYSDTDLAKIEETNPQYANYLRARRDDAAAFSQLTEAQRQLAETRYLSPQEINRRVREEGMFGTLTNRALNGHDFMHADFIHAIGTYVGAQERKAARELLQAYLAPHELHLDTVKLQGDATAMGKPNTNLRTTTGTPVTILNEKGKKVIYVGQQKYRQPDLELSPVFSALKDVFTTPNNRPIQSAFYPEPIADIIDDVAGFFSDSSSGKLADAFGKADATSKITQFVNAADTISKYWKVTTLLHPSWTINDILGNLFFMANMGINPVAASKKAGEAWRAITAIVKNDREAMKKIMFAGKTLAEHFDTDLGNVVGGHGAAETARQIVTGETQKPFVNSLTSAARKAVTGDFAGAKAEAKGVVAETIDAADKAVNARTFDQINPLDPKQRTRKAANALFEQSLVRRVWQPWAHLNGLTNDWLKVMAYMVLTESGNDTATAARLISEKMLDMSVLTSTDQKARAFVPFFNWMKHSAVMGVREFYRNPKFFSIAPKVKHALEESFNGEQNLPENARPSWIRDQLAMQIGTDPDTRRALTLTSSLPTEAATYALSFMFSPFMGAGALQDTFAYGTNSINPVFKIPLELGARREFFTKRAIDSQGGDITPTEYLIQQVRPFRELGIGSLRGGPLQRAFSDSPAMGVSRALVGGRLQPFDEERRVQNMQREYDDRVDALRRRINIAEREGQKGESLERRVELLRVFNEMKGLGLSVPKWAQRQTDSM